MRGTTLLYCSACTAIFSPPELLAAGAYYQDTYTLLREHTDFSAERRYIERLSEQWKYLRVLREFHPTAHSLLDIGCDRGYFLDTARRGGLQVQGIEPSQQARMYAESLGCSMYSSLENIPAEEKYDVVTMWHVLEHIPQPVELLRKVHTLYSRDNALILIRVPDAMSLTAALFGKKWVWLQPEHHVNHFSEKSLRLCLESAGFEVLLLRRQHASSLHTFIGHLHALATERQAKPDTSTLSSMCYSFARYIWHHATGCELFAVARRKLSM
jgi:2-polyprenyl-3-methyl-5-hydroxy-6-metoxy-1,4-benzoquinol methylase